MTTAPSRLQAFVQTGVIALLGTICIAGIGMLDGVCEDRGPSEAEEAKELAEHGDFDQLLVITDQEVALIHGHCFDEWLNTIQDSELLSHSWRWCSRGPPSV